MCETCRAFDYAVSESFMLCWPRPRPTPTRQQLAHSILERCNDKEFPAVHQRALRLIGAAHDPT